jgi:outer membrane biosynthesis protein TonB
MEGLEEEKRRKKKAMITTGAIQVVLFLLLYFLIAWREPNPPNPEYGIEVNFGNAETGSGDQPVQSPTPDQEEQPDEPAAASEASVTEETQQAENKVVPVETVKNPNADVVEEKKEEAKPKSSNTNTTQKETSTTKQTTQQQGTNTNTSQGNTGDKGDQGNPQGDINKDALYGQPGGGDNGSSLQMAGWVWDDAPQPKDTSDESGKIVYEVLVDEDGYIISLKLVTSTVSPAVEKKYATAVSSLTFSKTSSYKPAPSSKGIITFVIRSR